MIAQIRMMHPDSSGVVLEIRMICLDPIVFYFFGADLWCFHPDDHPAHHPGVILAPTLWGLPWIIILTACI